MLEKRKRDSINDALETVHSIPISDVKSVYQNKLELKIIVQAKIGERDIPSIVDSLRQIPPTLSSADRQLLLRSIFGDIVCEDHELEDYGSVILAHGKFDSPQTPSIQALASPIRDWINCHRTLSRHNKLCKVTVLEMYGKFSGSKLDMLTSAI